MVDNYIKIPFGKFWMMFDLDNGDKTRRVGGINGEHAYMKLSNGHSAKLHLKNVELI